MRLATDKRAVSMLIGALIAVIITVIFVVTVTNFVYGITSNLPTVRGAIGDPTAVVCFGGGDDSTVHCLEKKTGLEVFSFEAARKWKEAAKGAESTPILTLEGDIFFGVTNRFCAYTKTRQNKWPECKRFDKKIPTGVALNEQYVCFGGGEDKKVHCLERETGTSVSDYSVSPEFLEGPAISTPVLEDNTLYYAIGKIIKKQDLDSEGFDWRVPEHGTDITTDLAISDDYICYGITNTENNKGQIICRDKTTADIVYTFSEGGKALSTPIIENNYIYFGLGKTLQKWYIGPPKVIVWSTREEIGAIIPTGVALGDGLACYGEAGIAMICVNATQETFDAEELLGVIAPPAWDFRKAESTPIILDGVIYFGLGDKVCAYSTDARGTKMCDATTCPDALWCTDFDEQIPTGIAGLPAEISGEIDEE